MFIAGLLAHEGPFTPDALVDDVRDAARPRPRPRRDVGLLADESPVLEVGVGHGDPGRRPFKNLYFWSEGIPIQFFE